MLLPLLFLLVGFGLALAATGNAGGLVVVQHVWLGIVLSLGSAYLLVLAARGFWRHWQTDQLPVPRRGPALMARGATLSLLGGGLIVLALVGEEQGWVRFVSPGAWVSAGVGALLDLAGIAALLAGRRVRPEPRGQAALKPSPPTASSVGRTAAIASLAASGPAIGIGVLVAVMVAGPMGNCLTSCMGYDDAVIARLNACPKATALLGEPIREATWGWSCGNAEVSGSFGDASWTMPVEGPLGRGSVSFAAEMRGGPWQVLSGELAFGERTVDFVACRSAVVVNVQQVEHHEGQVVSVVGSVSLLAGASCTVVVGPGGRDGMCRAQVRCGDALLYGAGSTGYVPCDAETPAEGGVPTLSLQDRDATADGGDPMLDLRLSTGRVIVSDHGPQGLWAVHIQLGDGD